MIFLIESYKILNFYFWCFSVFYEEEGNNFDCKLWRYRSVIGYDNLLQVFSSQPLCESNKHPFLRKFLEEQPLLACTRYLPDFVSLYLKLVQKSSLIYNNKKLWDMCISDFLQFINKGTYSLIHKHSSTKYLHLNFELISLLYSNLI